MLDTDGWLLSAGYFLLFLNLYFLLTTHYFLFPPPPSLYFCPSIF